MDSSSTRYSVRGQKLGEIEGNGTGWEAICGN